MAFNNNYPRNKLSELIFESIITDNEEGGES